LWRVGQQAFITRSLYGSEDSIGRQAQKAMQEARDAKKNGGGGATAKPVDGKPVARKPVDKGTSKGRVAARNGSGNGATAGARARPQDKQTAASGASSAPKPHPRSRKKKKRK
jgi:hypothetical protein